MKPLLKRWLGTFTDAPTASSVVSASIMSMSLRVSGLLLSLLVQQYLARLLGVAEYGRYAIALGWAMLLVIVARRGLDDLALRVATHYHEDGRTGEILGLERFALRSILTIWVALAGFVVALKAMAPQFIPQLSWTLLGAIAVTVLALAILGFYSAMLLASGRVAFSQIFEQICRPLAFVALLLLAAAIGANPHSAEAGMVLTAGSLVIVLVMAWVAWRRSHRAGRPAAVPVDREEWHSISLWFVVMAVAQEGLNQTGILLLGIFGSNLEAGHFAAAWRYNSVLAFGLAAVGMVSGPMIASAHRRQATAELATIVRAGARFSLALAAIGAVALILLGPWLLSLFGEGFEAAYPALQILVIGSLVNASTGAVAYLLSLTGHHKRAVSILLAALATSIVLNMLLIPVYGAVGAAAASSAAQIVWNSLLLYQAWRQTGVLSWAFAPRPSGPSVRQ